MRPASSLSLTDPQKGGNWQKRHKGILTWPALWWLPLAKTGCLQCCPAWHTAIPGLALRAHYRGASAAGKQTDAFGFFAFVSIPVLLSTTLRLLSAGLLPFPATASLA